MAAVTSVLALLYSNVKLQRDQGIVELSKLLSSMDTTVISAVITNLVEVLSLPNTPWESKHGSLMGLKSIISSTRFKDIGNSAEWQEKEENIIPICLDLLVYEEVRVRLASGELIGSLCEVRGPQVYETCNSCVLGLIEENLERESKETKLLDDEEMSAKFRDHPAGPIIRRGSIDKTQIFHDTAGWKCLETSIKCLQSMVDGCGIRFRPYIDQRILDLLFRGLHHTNRFVRETGYYVFASLVSCGAEETDIPSNQEYANPFKAEPYGHQVAQALAIGLSDNWSQVRLAASEAARKFLLSFSDQAERESFYPELLPQMCLNRYYVADGVRIYSQETWRRVAKTEGKELVQKYIYFVVQYYISQTAANNHAVREAACACIAELAAKIEKEAVRPYVLELLETLVVCFQDDSWPVRDAACLACGNFILCFPEESRPRMPQLYPLFIGNLKDCIASVRQGAAGALASVVRAYGLEAFAVLEIYLREGISGLDKQASESEKYIGMDPGPATFSLVKRLRDNDMDLHTDKQMYSCGSLAPKMGRGSGCSDHQFKRNSEPWEYTDGCIHLIAELAQIPQIIDQICSFLIPVSEAVQKKHYTHHLSLLETICKRIPDIVEGVGKRRFKTYLEYYLDPIFYGLSCDNALTSSAASQCLNYLAKHLGWGVLRARVQEFNSSYVQQLDSNVQLAAF